MQNKQLEERMSCAKQLLELATSENIIERCQQYLVLLSDYLNELYKFRGTPEINKNEQSPLLRSAIEKVRKEIRASVEAITGERNRIEALLKSFTAISGYDALETFNQSCYKGFNDWELKAGGIRFGGGAEADKISIQEAVVTASLLRRENYVTRRTILEN